MNLPAPFLQEMKKKLGEKFPDFLQSYAYPAQKGIRVNTLKLSPEEFRAISPFSLEEIAWEKNGFYVKEEKVGAHPYHFAGLYYSQEPSAMSAAPLLDAGEGERVLDLCAAPGGKTTRLAEGMRGKGILVANEYVYDRAKILSQNVERLGIKNCFVVNADTGKLAEKFPAYFDKILVDAPCSGEGMFKKEPSALLEWSEENVARCATRQAEILENAAKMLKGGGRLVYSTCTFSTAENEGQIETFLRLHPEFSLLQMHALYPHEVRGEGHFVALLEKKGAEEGRVRPFAVKKNASAECAFQDFCNKFFRTPPQGTLHVLSDGRGYLLPDGAPDFAGLRLLRAGVEVGEWDGKIFKPSHALCMCAKKEDVYNCVSLTEQEAETYLRGEVLDCEGENGWCLMTLDGFPLGLGKRVNGRIKNHLPKGLRKVK
ncbi:MAG: RsmF rRNA methyltransferase first C-terminal domain-containing protein [Clostridia bacterium]|nr:RsmF rRNA methyltransferase first C-terminal domain-containing protein [Clostridia bacterium]